jgi:hypothetical protein
MALLEGTELPEGMALLEGMVLPEGMALPEGTALPEGVDSKGSRVPKVEEDWKDHEAHLDLASKVAQETKVRRETRDQVAPWLPWPSRIAGSGWFPGN